MIELAVYLLVFQMIHHCSGVYLHEKSRVVVQHPKNVANAGFGFAMAYQDGNPQRLVVGAPRDTFIGKVFTCPIKNVTTRTEPSKCDEVHIDFDSVTKDISKSSRDYLPNQSYYLGASIAATSDYFLVCAPLMTANITSSIVTTLKHPIDVVGACFVNNGTHFYQYYDSFQRYLHGRTEVERRFPLPKQNFLGGTGWNTLVDEANGLLLIMKTSWVGDILYVPVHSPDIMAYARTLKTYKIHQGVIYDWDISYVHNYNNAGFGVAAGKFSNDTMYAFNLQTQTISGDASGEILFLRYDKQSNNLKTKAERKTPVRIKSEDIATGFASVLDSADINQDGYTELLVGAPMYSDSDYGPELGAVHIYLGNETIKDNFIKLTIIGEKQYARFGSAIATSDADQDGIPDIFISAPYENEGIGAIYIFSGYGIKSLLNRTASYKQRVSQIVHRRIEVQGLRNFGFSFQVIADKNSTTCFGIAVSAPTSNSVVLFRCLPAIKVDLSTEPKSLEVSTLARQCTVKVCAHIRYPSTPTHMNTTKLYNHNPSQYMDGCPPEFPPCLEHVKLSVPVANLTSLAIVTDLMLSSRVKSPFAVLSPREASKTIDLSSKNETICNLITFDIINDADTDRFLFEAEVDLDKDMIKDVKEGEDFKDTWVTMSSESSRTLNRVIYRHCTGAECDPKLSLVLDWSGGSSREYSLGSSTNVTVIMTVRNDGNNSYDACVVFTIKGAPSGPINRQYNLVRPLRTYKEDIHMEPLDFASPNNLDTMLSVEAELREKCAISTNVTKSLNITYVFDTKLLQLKGGSHEHVITDSIRLDKTIEVLRDRHEYEIVNDGRIDWIGIQAVITVVNKPFFTSIITDRDCDGPFTDNSTINSNSNTTFKCNLDVNSKSTQHVTVIATMSKDTVLKRLQSEKLSSSSELVLHLTPTVDKKTSRITTQFVFKKELSLANDKDLIVIIAIVVAWLILAVVTFILYKRNFFGRKEKKNLEVLRESVRRHSVKKSVSERARSSCVDGEPPVNTEPLEDPFDEVQLEETPGGVKKQEHAQVH